MKTIVILITLLTIAINTQAKRPNILFIFTDDHGYQAISSYGSNRNKTPNIDRIASEGMRFDNCFVTNAICGPSRAVILTGKHSHLNGFITNGNRKRNQIKNGDAFTLAVLITYFNDSNKEPLKPTCCMKRSLLPQ